MNRKIDITGTVLTADRLTLRPWRESDLNDFYEYASVDGVGQMAGWNPHCNTQSKGSIEKCGFRNRKTTKYEMGYDTVENAMEFILCHPERSESRC